MKVLITGASGLVGQAVAASLMAANHEVHALKRGPAEAGEPTWDPQAGRIDATGLEGFDGVVHLAGENIAAGRWTQQHKQRVRDSRVKGTDLLARTLAGLTDKPGVLVCASAVGFYGHRGDEVLTEDASPGQGFLAEVCQAWEQAADPARQAGIRTVHLRFGMMLSAKGGALSRMLLPFKLGLGGPIGSGNQWWSWLALDDAAGVIQHALGNDRMHGPVNAAAPQAVTCRQFVRTLGNVLRRPTVLPMPALAARLVLGQMADELLLASARVEPQRLEQAGYTFGSGELKAALQKELGP